MHCCRLALHYLTKFWPNYTRFYAQKLRVNVYFTDDSSRFEDADCESGEYFLGPVGLGI